MGKNKNGGKGPSNTAPAKPHTVGNAPEDEKSKDNSNVLAEGEAMPGVDASVNAHACVDVNPPIVGHANPSVFPDAKRGRGDSFRKTQYIQGMYWRTGDVQVLVGGTHEFRLHQEILAAHSTFFSNQLRASADSDDIMVVTRSEDMPVIVLREITHEALSDVLRLLYPQPNAIKQPDYTSYQAERLLQTAVARFRELFRARIFARFEPVIQQADGSTEPQTHKGGPDSEAVMKYSATVTGGPDLGRCQQAILEALKLVFDVEGSGSHLAQYILKEEASITQNLETWLRLGGIGGGASLCKGCAESVGRVVQVYCRVEEMNARMERGLTLEK
ncbi:hypothetical protein FS749_000606 [Ceratobasidium sp. UAMH 11750]|nr:hypothetical protein FS749_000606 [Ceratobasidium sp. UAMH 11750]